MLTKEDIQAQQAVQIASQQEAEAARREHEKDMEARRAKMELLRMAKEIVVENARNKPTQEASVTAAEIVAFANELAAQLGD